MNAEQEPLPEPTAPENSAAGKRGLIIVMNFVIAVLLVLAGYFGHNFLDRYFAKPVPPVQPVSTEQKPEPPPPSQVIQVDVLNGSGEKGVASRFTNFIRARGYDVVEMKNYKTTNVPYTLVVDRVGNLQPARDLAQLLGVADTNVLQQLNPDYFVDVSVIIGKDCYELNPQTEKK